MTNHINNDVPQKINDNDWLVEFTIAEGLIGLNEAGQRGFHPEKPREEWQKIWVVGTDKNMVIDELISKIQAYKIKGQQE